MARLSKRLLARGRSILSLLMAVRLLSSPGSAVVQLTSEATRILDPIGVRGTASAGTALRVAAAVGATVALVTASSLVAASTPPVGQPAAWGDNTYGQLGVSGLTGTVGLAAGWYHSLALKNDGTISGAGLNADGQLGDGNLTNVIAIAAGGWHSLALKKEGTVWAWGSHSRGQNGNGGYGNSSSTPGQVTGFDNKKVIAIAAGDEYSLALTEDGRLWAWGRNDQGQLGTATSETCGTPSAYCSTRPIAVLTDVIAMAGGQEHTLAVRKSDGSVWAWGSNFSGQLGNGSTTASTSPVQVNNLKDIGAVAAGWEHSIAIQANGQIWTWGANTRGQLGTSDTGTCGGNPCSTSPVPVSSPSTINASAVAAGYEFNLVATRGGAVWGWGYNSAGQVGSSSDPSCYCVQTPVQITSVDGMSVVAAGEEFSLALARDLSREAARPDADVNTDHSRDPVNTLTGSYKYSHTDLALPGRGPSLTFVRSYESNDTRVGPLGPGWTHSYAVRLADSGRAGSTSVIVIGPQNRNDENTSNGDGTYTAPPGVASMKLAKVSGGTYQVTHQDQSTWNFDTGGKLTSVRDRYGNQASLTYNANGQLTSIGDPAGRGSLSFSYDTCFTGRLCSVSDWISRTVSFDYDGSGRLSSVTDREGKVTTYGYDGTTSRLTSIADARGNTAVAMTYDTQGRVATQTDAIGKQTTFTYTSNPDGTKVTTVTYPATSLDPAWTFKEEDTYDTQGRIVKRVSKPTANAADNVTVEYGYDAAGNRSSIKDGRGNTTTFCYDVDDAGAPISGSRGNVTRRLDPPPTTGAAVPVTLFRYDDRNNLLQTVPPKGVNSTASTTCASNLSASVNLAYATDLAYDASKAYLLSTTRRYTDPDLGQPVAITTTYSYSDTANPGLLTTVIPPRGNVNPGAPDYTYAITSTYYTTATAPSKAGMLQSVADALGNRTTYDYDAVGRRVEMVDPNGNAPGGVAVEHTWLYEYDDEDRLRFTRVPTPTVGAAQLVSESQYDAVGNRVLAIEPNGQITKYLYDARDSLQYVVQSPLTWTVSITPTSFITTEYQYDDPGNLKRVVRARGGTDERATDYAYDGLNRVRKETQYPNWPATGTTLVTEYTYDGNGNRLTLEDPLNQTTTSGYDALNRLVSIGYSDGQTPSVGYGYDLNGNRTVMTDTLGTTTHSYDELDRPITVTTPGPKAVGHRYDRDGNRTKVIYPDSTAVTYAFDQANRLASLLDWASRTTSYQYFPDGSLKTITNTNSTGAQLAYDHAGRLKDVWNNRGNGSTLNRHTYTLDAVGNRTAVQEVLAGLGPGTVWGWGQNSSGQVGDGTNTNRATPVAVQGLSGVLALSGGYYHSLAAGLSRAISLTYSYDRLARLTNANGPDGATSYSYDPAGNRLSMTRGSTTNYNYDKADRIQQAGSVNYTVNANGNLTARGSDSFGYDQANRLKTATIGGASSSYVCDGEGKRVSKTVAGATTTYVYDPNRSLPVVLDDGSRKYVWGLGLAYAVDGSGTGSVYHGDGFGSLRA